MISLGLGIGLLAFTNEPMTFFAGFAISLYMFSSDFLGSYQLLPEELGYGLIVVLIIIGVIVWLKT